MLRESCLSALTLLGLCCALPTVEPEARELPQQKKAPPVEKRLMACPFDQPSSDLGFDPPKALVAAQSSDSDEDDDDDDDDDSDDASASNSNDSGAVASFYSPEQGCLFVTGSVTAGVTVQKGAGPAYANNKGVKTSNAVTGEIDLTHLSRTEMGDLIVNVGLNSSNTTDTTGATSTTFSLTKASVTLGPWIAGLDVSFFDTWTGDPFSFAALTPVATTGLIGYKYDATDKSTFSFSLEDPVINHVARPETFSGVSYPDAVGRYRWSNGTLDIVATGAAHRIDYWQDTALTQSAHDWGYAGKVYAKYTLPTEADGSYILAQATTGLRAPAYLGITADSGKRSRFQLSFPDTLTAKHFEHGHGWGVDLVGNYALNDKWQTGAFVSYLDYRWFSLQSGAVQGLAHVQAYRTAWNVSYSPISNLTIAAEVGVGSQRSNKVQGIIYPIGVGTLYTSTLTLSRTF